jgi:uncharacterized protein
VLNEQSRYESCDMPFYRQEILPVVGKEILDFHVHLWLKSHWKETPWNTDTAGGKYMVVQQDYSYEAFFAETQRMFPGVIFNAVCFGMPTPSVELNTTNDYLTQMGSQHKELFPLRITGKDMTPADELKKQIQQQRFFGYKVFLNWYGDDYGAIRISDMIGPSEMGIADKLGLVVLLHVPSAGRLADPNIQNQVEQLAKTYPGANIVLAHCGRCYCPDEMQKAIKSITKLENVYLDTAMVMDPTVIEIILDNIDSRRLLFATDLPVANMRGRRVYVMDHWVDVVLEGYPASSYRIPANNIRATFMAYEIILAIKRAAERVGLSEQQLRAIFFDNGMRLLRNM